MPDRADIGSDDAWTEAMDFLGRGLPFHAHEIFEQRWKCCPTDERDTWQALAQWGAALTHQARGNEIGQRRIASRSRERLEEAREKGGVPPIVDVDVVLRSLAQLT